jgi:dTDP-4-dehydrorhamnose 3,5-epimerase
MIFVPTLLSGTYLVKPEPREDHRGSFARIWCQREFQNHGLDSRVAQCSISMNRRRGTLRGMHYQMAPHAETKLVRCTKGAVYDVILDLRRDSPTFKLWIACELTDANQHMIFVPAGCAHGFQTLTGDTEICYQITPAYHAECAAGVRWDDAAFGIHWPLANPILSEKDHSYRDFH